MAVSLTGQGQKNEAYYQEVMREAFGRTFELCHRRHLRGWKAAVYVFRWVCVSVLDCVVFAM